MKAVLCKALDGIGGLSVETLLAPSPGAGEVVVAVKAVALNFFDTLIIAGRYQTKPALPFSPGGEIAGLVHSVGTGVADWQPGQRCVAYTGYGGAREQVVVAAERLVPIPHGVTFEAAAAVPITYGTAVHAWRDRGALQSGETVAILGAAGGAGLAAIEVAKAMGARVIAVALSAEKRAACRAVGADDAVAADGDIKAALRAATEGRGLDLVYDCVGGDLAEPAFRALAWRGRYLIVGFASGDIPSLPLNLFLVKGASAVGVFYGEAVTRDPDGYRRDLAFALQGVAEGRLNPQIGAQMPLCAIAQGLELIVDRKLIGKVVLTV